MWPNRKNKALHYAKASLAALKGGERAALS